MKRMYGTILCVGVAWSVMVAGCSSDVDGGGSGDGKSGLQLGAVSSELAPGAAAAVPDNGPSSGPALATVSDIVIGSKPATEIRSSDLLADRDLKGLKALREEGIAVLPWKDFLQQSWMEELI